MECGPYRLAVALGKSRGMKFTPDTAWLRAGLMGLLALTFSPLQSSGDDRADESGPTTAASSALVGDAQVGDLIEQLGNPSYRVRAQAAWQLSRIGLPAFGQLRRAVDHPDIQIATAARYLVQSQNVTWWLETDSSDVRRLLDDYNRLNEVERNTRLQRLAHIGTPDALLALCRLARFESDDELSKSAALHLMERIASATPSPSMARSILLTLGDDPRPATEWLKLLSTELEKSSANAEAWRVFAEAESATTAQIRNVMEGRRSIAEINSIALRFYRWVGMWLTRKNGRDEALEIAQQSLELVPQNPFAYREFAKWAIMAQLPELVVKLAAQHEEIFKQQYELGFLLAECHGSMGNQSEAERLAQEASQQIDVATANIANGMGDYAANRRVTMARQLSDRGMFAWAEREYKQALTLETSPNVDAEVRNMFAEFYWSGNEPDKAAAVLLPVHERQADNVEQGLPGPMSPMAAVSAYYYFYAGLAAAKSNDEALAMQMYVKALEEDYRSHQQANPDVVIAMKKIAHTPERQAIFDKHFDKMLQDFRRRVITAEQVLAESVDRRSRAYIGSELASACNQLAWLLSMCGMHGEEALNLSRRSLEFRPTEPAFLDTLARCQFSAGKVAAAVESQKQALELVPHDRQMKVQLAEFEQALEAQSTKSP